MPIRSASGLVYTAIAWTPLLALVVGIGWVLAVGVLNLELYSSGTTFFLDDATNLSVRDMFGAGDGHASEAARLQAALDSGDPEQMQAALAATSAG